MNAYTHRRALAAAARLALATVALDACDKDRSDPTPPAPQPDDEATHADGGGEQVAKADEPAPAPEAKPVESNAPVDPIRECRGLVDEAFPKESEYPGEQRNVGAKVQTCCAELLVHETGDLAGRHRWDCCANLPEGTRDPKVGMACTPWGPPVPPRMRNVEVA
ncbi:MAG TPA: hypothetical protein VG755_22515 [Nannocystaceae bacterium]|nr:hypothetical protein [Nannocystaceae bacterium]